MTMGVSCIIAAYNEERLIGQVIAAVRGVEEVTEIIVVSDGSTDRTAEVAVASGADVIVQLPKNLGKGGAILAGARRASERVLLLLDADLENLKPCELEALIRRVVDGDAHMAVGVLAGDLRQAVVPHLSGIRVVHRDCLLCRPHLAATRFGFERALTKTAWRERWKVARVRFTGVNHHLKEEKYGFIQGWRGKVRMTVEVVRVRRPRRYGARGPRSRVLALTTLVVTLAYLGMGLFTTSRVRGSTLEPFPEPTPEDRYLIVAAHADDELLAAGGLIQRAHSVGAQVWVVFGTNGDGNRLAAAITSRRPLPRPADFIAEGMLRQREALQALGRLGVPPDHVFFLGYPDRGLWQLASPRRDPTRPYVSPFTKASASPYRMAFRPNAPYTGKDLLHDLGTILTVIRPTVVLTHHPADRHSDHQALYQFVRQAIRAVDYREHQPPRLYTYLVHAWDFPRPFRYAPEAPLLPPKSMWESTRWLRFDLLPEELEMKRTAMRDYRSQLDSPYLRLLMSSFIRQNELFAVAEP
ncbi:MAG: PIG-L family deacetylase [Armatimonadetes bacterium]|nr:PIG-L family deacetylase [Armatimonadota bacterium]